MFAFPDTHRKVLFGAMTVTSYSKSSKENGGEKFAVQKSAEKMFTPKSEPCCLFPEEGNIHEIRAHGYVCVCLCLDESESIHRRQ